MGCKNSNENQRELFNEDVDIKRRFLTGIHISKGAQGIEGNVQIALGTTCKKKYDRVNQMQTEGHTPEEDIEDNVQNVLECT